MRHDVSSLVMMGEKAYVCPLAEFPKGAEVFTSSHGAVFHEVPPGVKVVAYDENTGKPVAVPVLYWSQHQPHEVVVVELASGRTIMTDDDPRGVYGIDPETMTFKRARPSEAVGMLVPRVDKSEEVTTGFTVGAFPLGEYRHQQDERIKDKVALTREIGYFFGALIGDGWVSASDGVPRDVCLSGADEPVFSRWIEATRELTVKGEPLTTCRVEAEATGDGVRWGDCSRLTVSCRYLARAIGPLIGTGSANKHLPPFFASAPREFQLGLLEGLIDTDGSIRASKAKGKKNIQVHASYTTQSARLASEITHLNRLLGVYCRVRPCVSSSSGNPAFDMNMSIADLGKLDLSLCCERKMNAYKAAPKEEPQLLGRSAPVVPASVGICRALAFLANKDKDNSSYVAFSRAAKSKAGFVTARLAALYGPRLDDKLEHVPMFKKLIQNTGVVWDRVVSFTNSGISEIGYDLTVPGYETFMAADGVVLSNTLIYYVPTSPEAVKEAWEKMLPTKNLLSARFFKASGHFVPQEEFITGAWLASRIGKGDTVKFATKEEALAAYQSGRIKSDTPISIG